jgi:glycosyltransferase involved in cell wall biosynthesis
MSADRPPKVSIVLPNYNYAHYLDQRIQSLLNQTFTDFELVVVDDGSTDDSLEVIGRYTEDPRVRTMLFEQNSGSAYPRWNDGACVCRGDYLMFAGADDSCEPTFLERMVPLLDAHPRVGLAYSQVWITDADGRRLYTKQYWNRPDHWAADYVNDGIDECRQYLCLHCTIPTASSLLMRRSIFEEVGPFDVSLRLAADWMLYAKFLQRCDIAYVAQPLVDFRTHASTSRSNATRSLRRVSDSYRVVTYIATAVGLPPKVLERLREQTAQMLADFLLLGKGLDDAAELRAVLDKAKAFDPGLRGRLLRQLITRAPVGGIGRRLSRAVAVCGKTALRRTLGSDAVEYGRALLRRRRRAGSV